MLTLDRLTLTDFLLYKNQDFTFEPGITVVRGQNRSGKSLLFSSIKTLLFDEGSLPSGGRAVLSGVKDDTSFDITGWSSGKSNRYSLTIDGVEQQTDTIAKSRAAIDKMVDLSGSLYTTTIGLTGLQPHPLASGKPASRLDWIHATLAFSELYDAYLEKVDAHIKEVKSKAIEYDVLNKELTRLKSDEPKQTKEPSGDIQDIRDKLTRLQKRRDSLYLLTSIPNKPRCSVKKLKKLIKRVSDELDELQKLRNSWDEYTEKRKRYVKYRDKYLSRLTESFDALNVPEDLRNNLSKLQKQVTKRIVRLTVQEQDIAKNNRLYDEQTDLRELLSQKDVVSSDETLESVGKKLQSVTDKIAYYKVSMTNTGDVCIFCNKDLSKLKEDAETDLNKLQSRKKKLQTKLTFLEALEKKDSLVEKLDIKFVQQQLTKLTELSELLDTLDQDSMTAPVKPKTAFDEQTFSKLKRRRQSLQEELQAAETYYKMRSKLDAEDLESVEDPEQELKKVDRKLKALTEEASLLSDKLIEFKTSHSLHTKWVREVEELTKRVDDLSKYPKRLKVLNLLKQAFGRDGLRTDTLASSMELFINNLNQLAEVIWPEPFKFEIDVGPRKCDVIVHRNRRKGSIFSLSGAEQRGWQLISALALIRILPSHSRCDTIILDELEANSSKETRDRFIYDFLPELRRSVDKINIVTPLVSKEFSVPCDREFTVVKKNGFSYLREV